LKASVPRLKNNPNARTAAVHALYQVIVKGRSLSSVLPEMVETLKPSERPLMQELTYGVLRFAPRLEVLVCLLLERPLKAKDRALHCLLMLGLYQLAYMRVPAHAIVSETVAVAAQLDKAWAKGVVNGVLRSFQRDMETLNYRADQDEVADSAHPAWLLAAIKSSWPDDREQIILANNARAPMSLRVNIVSTTREDYLEQLAGADIAASPIIHTVSGLQLEAPADVSALPGFDNGQASVQDGAAQQAALLMGLEPGQRILDACAAPGGKTAHILETMTSMGDVSPDVSALDVSGRRLERVRQNLSRLQLRANLITGDATEPDAWWDGETYDRILLDAPCSATGVVRRHPDIKVLRKAEDIALLAAQQTRMLNALWPLLTPGGLLLYATCSILPDENAEVVKAFMATCVDAQEEELNMRFGRQCQPGWQILTGEQGMDGFYYAKLRKH